MNKSVIHAGLVVLLVASIGTNVGVFYRLDILKKENANVSSSLGALKKEVANFKELRIHLPSEILERVESTLEGSVKNLKTTVTDKTNSSITTMMANYDKTLTAISKEAEQLAKHKILGNEVAAEEAYKTAQKFTEKKDFATARIYCLNAINHAPNKKQYFESLVKISKSNDISPTQSDLEQIRSVLELGLYQVDSNDIPAMTKMLEGINAEMEKNVEESARQRLAQESESLKYVLSDLKNGNYAWDKLINAQEVEQVVLAQERLNKLNDLLTNYDTSISDAQWLTSEFKKTSALLEYVSAVTSIKNTLAKAENLLYANPSIKELPAISSMVQTANNVLSQAWNIDFSNLPKEMSYKFTEQAQQIATLEIKFNKIKSQPALVKIGSIKNDIVSIVENSHSSYTYRINKIQENTQTIVGLMQEVYDSGAYKAIKEDIVSYSETLKKYDVERYKAYQSWTVRKCNDAFKLYSSWKVVSQANATQVVKDHLLQINPAHLTPDVARLYQDVLSKQFAEMGWKRIAEMETILATTNKKSLEDF